MTAGVTRAQLETELALASIPPRHLDEVLRLVEKTLADARNRSRVDQLTDLLRSRIGRSDAGPVFDESDASLGPGRGGMPLTALLLTAGDVADHLRGRGLPQEICRATTAELGRQVERTVRTTGSVGLADAAWVAHTWRAQLLTIGRLQYELTTTSDGRCELNTHIPADAPLDPHHVRASLRSAKSTLTAAYPERGPMRWAVCDSWLLDPQLAVLMPGSNVARFGALWAREAPEPCDQDALHFVFDLPRDPRVRVEQVIDRLDPRTKLQRAVMELWRSGGHVQHCRGRIDLDALEPVDDEDDPK